MSVYVFTAVCVDLAKYKPKSCDMNITLWLFSHLACKEVYHMIIFICTACLCNANKLGKCIKVSYQGSPHTLSLQYEAGFICICDSIEMRILLDM